MPENLDSGLLSGPRVVGTCDGKLTDRESLFGSVMNRRAFGV